ncbi:hypothetical protein KAI87_02405, partial [Myxococcota bacterium]|nr:hypothetical protein [Myxococcota bacterium]
MTRQFILIALFMAATQVAQAAEVRGRFSTLMAGRQDPRAGDVVDVIPLYELVALEVAGLELPGMDSARFVLNGWGRLQLGDDEERGHGADLGLFYLEAEKAGARIKIGRQHVIQGLGRMHMIDGLNINMALPYGLAVQAFGGATVHPEFKLETGDMTAGARLSKRITKTGEVGLSYTQMRNTEMGDESEVSFEQLGVDG